MKASKDGYTSFINKPDDVAMNGTGSHPEPTSPHVKRAMEAGL
jgi:hypothetical protein